MDYDVIVIGAGHNALIAAAYLAQAGYRVTVFERRSQVGGAVSTEEIIPGFRFDLGGSAHILIRLTPIVDELELHRYGLRYIELDPLFFSPTRDSSIIFYRDAEATADALDLIHPGEGEAYRRFLSDWLPFSRSVLDTFLSSPSPFELGKSFALGPASSQAWQRALPQILRPYGEVLDDYFHTEALIAPMVWMAAQSGPPPGEPLSAPFLLWHPLYHEGGMARPEGGSGMLTQALHRHIEAHGGSVYTAAPVEEILMERGRARGVRVGTDVYTSRAVLAGTHVLESLGRLLPPHLRPAELSRMRVGNGFGAIVRLALSKPVQYPHADARLSRTGLQLLCRDRQQIQSAYGEYLQGRPASDPPLVAMTFSAADSTLVPEGGEALWIWGQYYPYNLAGNMSWDDISFEVEQCIIDQFERYAPGTRDSIVGTLFQHPAWLEREMGLYRGNVMHLEMSLDQMFLMRPSMNLSRYKSHLEGLFLTGASTHPGGGIMGASGRSAARVVLRYLS